jgi:flagellar biosynthetic protein FlhB
VAGEDKHSKKHPASAKKKQDLKKKGTVPKSQDVPMAFGLVAAFGVLVGMKGFYMHRFEEMMPKYFSTIADVRTPEGMDIFALMRSTMLDVAVLSAPVLCAVVVMALISNIAQTGLIFTGEQLKPNLNKLNPMTKIKQWFSIKSLQELGKSLGKILLASVLGFLVFKSFQNDIAESVQIDSAAGLMALGATIIKKLFIYIIILYVVIASIDFGMQKKNFSTEHKMTDKEVKDEYKNSEGDPYMKQKRRQIAQQIAMSPPAEHVPQSNVVVINPTELAIALKYDPEVSAVPWVVARGETFDADDIRASARAAGVPVVRNKPLARALFEMCEVGDIVPEDLYRPVAEILAYVFQLKEQMRADSSDAAAAASPMAAHSNDAAASAQRVDSADAEGVYDLASVQVPVTQPTQAAPF